MGFSSKSTRVGCCALLQGIFLTQGLNPPFLRFLHWQMGSLPLVPPGKLTVLHTIYEIFNTCFSCMHLILPRNSLNLLCCFIHGFVAKARYNKSQIFSNETFPSGKDTHCTMYFQEGQEWGSHSGFLIHDDSMLTLEILKICFPITLMKF